LNIADAQAREEVKQRATMQQKLAEKEKQQKEEHLRMLAQKAREDRALGSSRRDSRSRSRSSYESDESGSDREDAAKREREEMRRERRRENERQLRQSRMGAERRLQMMAREQGRDISEKIALGMAKPTASGESMYDSRLFNQSSGFAAGFNEDQPYDKPLFAAQEAISSIYRPKITEDDVENADETMERIQKSGNKRFEGFSGTKDAEAREGPVQFEKDNLRAMKNAVKSATRGDDDDPFGIDEMISEVTGGKAGKKRYGLNEPQGRESKRARVDEDSSGD
jgi:SNW domain-containing protein 1